MGNAAARGSGGIQIRKTARRQVQAAQEAGLRREAGFAVVDDDLVAVVVSVVRSGPPSAWKLNRAQSLPRKGLEPVTPQTTALWSVLHPRGWPIRSGCRR